jgi:uncharacterized protein with PIN domain
MRSVSPVQFACDAMLGGLARWLRAAGYDASWQAGIADWHLIRQAREQGRVLLTCDTGIFRIGIVRDGDVPAILLPHSLATKQEQLAYVLERLHLEPLSPRCMACGGALAPVAKEAVRDRAPPRTFAQVDQFYECTRCGQLFWEGTHWQQIAAVLEAIRSRPGADPEAGR